MFTGLGRLPPFNATSIEKGDIDGVMMPVVTLRCRSLEETIKLLLSWSGGSISIMTVWLVLVTLSLAKSAVNASRSLGGIVNVKIGS